MNDHLSLGKKKQNIEAEKQEHNTLNSKRLKCLQSMVTFFLNQCGRPPEAVSRVKEAHSRNTSPNNNKSTKKKALQSREWIIS